MTAVDGAENRTGFGRRIRVGVLVDGDNVPAWAHAMLNRIAESDYAEIVQIVENVPPPRARRSLLKRLGSLRKRLFYMIFVRLDRVLSRVVEDPFRPVSIRSLPSECRWLRVTPERQGFVDRFDRSSLESLARDRVDVYVRLGFRILKGDILTQARFGVWSYHHGDNRVNRGLPPGFWELFDNERVTGVTLQRLSEELDGGEALCRSFVKTNEVYMRRTQAHLFWVSSALIPRMLKRLHDMGDREFAALVKPMNSEPVFYCRPLYSYPSNRQAAWVLLRSLYRIAVRRVTALAYKDQWILCYLRSKNESSHGSLWRYAELRPPSDRFWADPFVVERDGESHLFFEELLYADGVGHISHLRISADGVASKPEVVLESDHHLSYPYIVEDQEELYMVPESAAAGRADLYRCTRFPDEWEFVATLLDDVELIDPTLFRHDGRWWLFCCLNETGRRYGTDELYIYSSESLLGQTWEAHPLNPVISDVRCARPAGQPFVRGGALYRPAQDGSRTYGGSISLRRVVRLSRTEYEEEAAGDIHPGWGKQLAGIHTLNRSGSTSVVDVLRRIRRISA